MQTLRNLPKITQFTGGRAGFGPKQYGPMLRAVTLHHPLYLRHLSIPLTADDVRLFFSLFSEGVSGAMCMGSCSRETWAHILDESFLQRK